MVERKYRKGAKTAINCKKARKMVDASLTAGGGLPGRELCHLVFLCKNKMTKLPV